MVQFGGEPVRQGTVTAESWLNQQVQYDLWVAEQSAGNIKVKQLVAA